MENLPLIIKAEILTYMFKPSLLNILFLDKEWFNLIAHSLLESYFCPLAYNLLKNSSLQLKSVYVYLDVLNMKGDEEKRYMGFDDDESMSALIKRQTNLKHLDLSFVTKYGHLLTKEFETMFFQNITSHINNLTSLRLNCRETSAEYVISHIKSSSIKILNLTLPKVPHSLLLAIAKRFSHLQALIIFSGIDPRDYPMEFLNIEWPNLRTLYLPNILNNLLFWSNPLMFPKLESVRSHGNRYVEMDFSNEREIQPLSLVKSLHFRVRNSLFLRSLSQIFPNLTSLSCSLNFENSNLIDILTTVKSLTSLNLGANHDKLFNIRINTNLTRFSLTGTLGQGSLDFIFYNMPKLKELKLEGCHTYKSIAFEDRDYPILNDLMYISTDLVYQNRVPLNYLVSKAPNLAFFRLNTKTQSFNFINFGPEVTFITESHFYNDHDFSKSFFHII